jgi:hypothetical protein
MGNHTFVCLDETKGQWKMRRFELCPKQQTPESAHCWGESSAIQMTEGLGYMHAAVLSNVDTIPRIQCFINTFPLKNVCFSSFLWVLIDFRAKRIIF